MDVLDKRHLPDGCCQWPLKHDNKRQSLCLFNHCQIIHVFELRRKLIIAITLSTCVHRIRVACVGWKQIWTLVAIATRHRPDTITIHALFGCTQIYVLLTKHTHQIISEHLYLSSSSLIQTHHIICVYTRARFSSQNSSSIRCHKSSHHYSYSFSDMTYALVLLTWMRNYRLTIFVDIYFCFFFLFRSLSIWEFTSNRIKHIHITRVLIWIESLFEFEMFYAKEQQKIDALRKTTISVSTPSEMIRNPCILFMFCWSGVVQ